MNDGLRASDWTVRPIAIADGRQFVESFHYARGASKTAVYLFGLFWSAAPSVLFGVTWWLPPTRVAAESIDPVYWQQVLSLSRMAVMPFVPKNACSFMVSRAVKTIRRDRRFVALVTYADERRGHSGLVYRACNWTYAGVTAARRAWVDPATGRQVSAQATRTRTVAEMRAFGYVQTAKAHPKHKFVLRLAA